MIKKTSVLLWLALAVLSGACAGTQNLKTPSSPTAAPPGTVITAPPAATPSAAVKTAAVPEAQLKLPDTGQVKDNTSTFGEDSDYTLNPPAYKSNGDGTVIDLVTGLVWQQPDGGEMTYDSAAPYCQNLELAGLTDWRLPTSQELFSILDHDRNPALNPVYFPVANAGYWWSASVQVDDSARAWVVNSGGGTGAHPIKETVSAGGSKNFHTRCVRGPSGYQVKHLSAGGNGSVADANTGLVWQQGEGAPAAWEGALSYCENLTLAGRSDWRLPNIKELRSLSDDTLFRPSIDQAYFPGAQARRYWSSTTLAGKASSAWFIDFLSGLASYTEKADSLFIRCVSGS